MANIARDERRWTITTVNNRPTNDEPHLIVSGPLGTLHERVEVVPAADLRGAIEALRPFVEAYVRVGREFCPEFHGPDDLAAFEAAARIIDGGR